MLWEEAVASNKCVGKGLRGGCDTVNKSFTWGSLDELLTQKHLQVYAIETRTT